MEILFAIIILILSFALIIWGGDVFVNSSVAIAKKLKISTSIIGATLVSVGTTLPEILVTIFSITNNAGDIALGNALGSVVFNCCVIGGILLCFTTILIKNGWHLDYWLLIFALISTLVYGTGGKIGYVGSICLLMMFFVFIIINIYNAKSKNEQENLNSAPHTIWFHFLIFILASAMVGFGAYFLVEKAKFLARMAGFSELFIGLTIIAFGTSLPELITTINAIRKNEPGLGLGNIVGANIINSTLLVGLTGVCSNGIIVGKDTLLVTLPVAIISNLILLLPSLIKKRTYKWQGFALMIFYALYYAFLIFSSLGLISV